MAHFQIEQYSLRIGRTSGSSFAIMSLSSPRLQHGIMHRATLSFAPSISQLSGAAHNVGAANFDGIHVSALLPFDDLDRLYNLVQTEAPLNFIFSYQASDTTSKPLSAVIVATSDETPGEGPADADAFA